MNDPCLYVKKTSSRILIVALYVDDLLVLGNSKQDIATLKGGAQQMFRDERFGRGKTDARD